MDKQLLITVSDNYSSMHAVRFVHDFFCKECPHNVTLFYVAQRPQNWDVDQVLQPEQAALENIEQQKKLKGAKALDKAWSYLTSRGMDPSRIKKKVVHSRMGTLNEILQEGTKGLYDAVVLGRRGLSWFSELVEDSISHKIMWGRLDFPIWICRRSENPFPRKDVLLLVDTNDETMRIADHVGYILEKDPSHNITLFHVKKDNLHVTPKVESAFELAQKALADNNVPEEQVNVKVAKGNVVETILKEAHNGNYAVVAVGRTSGSPNALQRFAPGSISSQLLQKLDDCSLWVSK